MRYRVQGGAPLRGTVHVPGDKSVGHRALLFAALSSGSCRIRGLSGGLDNQATADIFRRLGVSIEDHGDLLEVHGVGLRGLKMPSQDLDCGNSGTSLRLLAGLLSAQEFGCRLVGDRSLERRPMARVVEPLRARGANIDGSRRDGEVFPPLRIAPLLPSEKLTGLEYELPVASAQVKSALLLSGLYADGPTALKEPVVSRDHTERMMLSLGVPITTQGSMVVLDPGAWNGAWDGFEWEVPADFSSAAFFLAAGHMVPESELTLEAVGVNPTRTGMLDALRLMGADMSVEWKGEESGGEPVADLSVRHRQLRGTVLGGELLTRMIDEVPALCALAACCKGTTEIRDGAELRVKETDRIAAMGMVLRAFGCPCDELPDGIVVQGGHPLRGTRVESLGDHRVAMSAALLGLVADGETVVEDVGCVDTSFPGFPDFLRTLGGRITAEDS